MRFYFVGAHSTGKTTLARQLAHDMRLPLITEVARTELAIRELTLDKIHQNLDVTDEYQLAVWAGQLREEARHPGGFVSDRSFDCIAYAAEYGNEAANCQFRDPRFEAYMGALADACVFFVRPQRALLAPDGVRTDVDWDSAVRIDGMIKLLLQMFAVPYVSINTASQQERIVNVYAVATRAFGSDS